MMMKLKFKFLRRAQANKQQDQADHPQGLWLPEYPEPDGYGVSGMLKYQGTTSEPKT